MTRPLRYRTELGICQHKQMPAPLRILDVMWALMLVGAVVALVLVMFSLEA